MSITEDEPSLSYSLLPPAPPALPNGTAWMNLNSLVTTCNIRVQFHYLGFAFLSCKQQELSSRDEDSCYS